MTQIRNSYADIESGQIHYRFAKGSGTPLVFLHQTASSSKMYTRVMEKLASTVPMYALDTPGFGGSFDPEGMPGMTRYADWIFDAIDAIGLTKFHLFGHHTGSSLAVEIAARHPDRVASLMMIGPLQMTQAERDEYRKYFSTPFSPTADGSYLKETWDYLAKYGAGQDLALHHREVVDHLRAYHGRYQTYSSVWDQDFPKYFAEVKCPIMIMSAEDDVLHPYFERARKARPDAVAVMIEGQNFEPDLAPDAIASAIRMFLKM